MRKMAENAREANAQAYETMQGQVKDAVETVKKSTKG